MIAGIVNIRAGCTNGCRESLRRRYAENDITKSLVTDQFVQPSQAPPDSSLPDLRKSSEIEGDPAVALALRTAEPITIPE